MTVASDGPSGDYMTTETDVGSSAFTVDADAQNASIDVKVESGTAAFTSIYVLTATAAESNVTTNAYNDLDQLTSVTDAESSVTSYTRCPTVISPETARGYYFDTGLRFTATDPHSEVWTYTIGGANEARRVRQPDEIKRRPSKRILVRQRTDRPDGAAVLAGAVPRRGFGGFHPPGPHQSQKCLKNAVTLPLPTLLRCQYGQGSVPKKRPRVHTQTRTS